MALYEQDDGRITGYCFSCTHYDPDPYGDNKTGQMESHKNNTGYFETIGSLPIKALPTRKLSEESLKYFDVRSEVSTVDGETVVAQFYPYAKDGVVTGYKKRTLPKEFVSVGDLKNVELFGQAQAAKTGSQKLWITEGEIDAVTLYQVLKEHAGKWKHLEPAVVSLAHGVSGAVKELSKHMAFLGQFKEIILCFDNDAKGEEGTQAALQLLPNALTVKMDEKDCNDMLVKGKSEQLWRAALWNAQKHKPASVVSVDDVFERAIAKPTEGFSWPWPTLTKATYGIKRKTIYGLGAGVGLGKTEFATQLQSHLVYNHGLPIGIFSFEADVGRSLKGIAGKNAGKLFHVPDGGFSDSDLREAIATLRDKVFMYDHVGTRDWNDVKAAIRYMVVSEGIKDIFLDPMTALVSHLTSGEANDALNTIMGDISSLVHELDFTLYYFCHLNTPNQGPPHERGGKVVEQQFTGSRAMMRYSNYLLGLEGNKDPELAEAIRNTRNIVVLKDREYGHVCQFPVHYDTTTGTLLEQPIVVGGY